MNYQKQSKESILSYARNLIDCSLRDVCCDLIDNEIYSGKGNFGQILEKYYFGYEPNSLAEPDFVEAGIELKASPLKIIKKGEIRSKERLVLNIINYMEVHKEEFYHSSFWKKNAHLLLVFYLYEKDKSVLDYIIKLVDDWQYPPEDLQIIKKDWQFIQNKIKSGKAHELSEGDTYYLGACTKGSTAESSYREQPFNQERAKQRAYSLKQGYVNHIIASIAGEKKEKYGKLITSSDLLIEKTIEDVVIERFAPFIGKSPKEIKERLNLELNPKAKSYFALLTKAILGISLGHDIEEFEKASIQVKTVRLKANELPKEHISFPSFKYEELVNTHWDDSDFKNMLEQKFFFVFYQFIGTNLILRKVKFWNMPTKDIEIAREVYVNTQYLVTQGNIVCEVTNKGIRKTNFLGKKDNKVSHVRPHAQNANDTYPLPVSDQLTGLKTYTKHCFWLNDTYIRDEIYLK